MAAFFPKSLNVRDTATPMDVLVEAQADWRKSSNGVLSLRFRGAVSEKGDALIYVYAEHVPTERTTELLRIAHRMKSPFPLTIIFEKASLPTYLKRSYPNPVVKALPGISSVSEMSSSEVENPWVCDTPGEFRVKLEKAFNERIIVAELQSLLSAGEEAPEALGEEIQSDETVERLSDSETQN